MPDIFELLRQKCSDGVPAVPLGRICKIQKGVAARKNTLSDTRSEETPFPVMNMGREISGYYSKANKPAGTIVISGHGMTSGSLSWMGSIDPYCNISESFADFLWSGASFYLTFSKTAYNHNKNTKYLFQNQTIIPRR